MINIHLNGEIVRCPDIVDAKKRLAEQREATNRCIFGVPECRCQVFQQYAIRNSLIKTRCDCYSGRCKEYKEVKEGQYLWRKYVCPRMQLQYINGLKQKEFGITSQTYRAMASATHDLIKSTAYRTLFITLTFPPFKIEPNEKQINECFSRFVENLRKNYGCNGYVAVRELGETNNRQHFHIVLSMPYHPFLILNSAWCHSIQKFCDFSTCALRTTKKSLYIKNPVKAIRYCCKYFAKTRGQKSGARLVFISNNLIRKPIKRYKIVLQELLEGYKGIYIRQTSDFTTCFRITNDREFMRFCHNYLYEAFENDYKYPLFNKGSANFNVPSPDY